MIGKHGGCQVTTKMTGADVLWECLVREGVTDPVSLALGAEKHEQSAGEIDGGECDGRVDGVD